MNAIARLRRVFINHPGVDYILAVLGASAYLVATAVTNDAVPGIDLARRATLLQTLSGISLGTLGVAATAAAIVGSLAPRPRVAALVSLVSERLGSIVLGALAVFGLISLSFAALIVVDDRRPTWLWAVCVALVVLLAARAARLLWILAKLFVGAAREEGTTHPRHPDAAPVAGSVTLDPEQFTLEAAQRKPG
jgi:hypothetical protein